MSNDDTLDLDQAVDQASSTLKIDQDEVDESVDESPQVQEESKEVEEAEDKSASPDGEEESDESKEESTDEETFLDKVPTYNELPEEMKAIYKNWQKQYTTKREAERAEIKALKAELEETKKSQAQEPKTATQQLNQQEQRDTRGMTQEQLDKYLDQREEQRYLKSQETQFFKLDSRLNSESPDFDPYLYGGITEQVIRERDAFDKENGTFIGFDFVGRSKELIKQYDQKLKQKGQEAIKEKTQKSQAFMDKSRKENIKAKSLTGKTNKPLDLDEAVDKAFSNLSS